MTLNEIYQVLEPFLPEGISTLIVSFVVWVSFRSFRSYLGSYLSSKAANLATKEDIGEITKIVEKAKNLATKEDIGEITKIVEKAKNLATKEDIEEITRKIESVKFLYNEQLEILKNHHNLLAMKEDQKHQLRMAALEKRLEVHQEAYAKWHDLCVNSDWRGIADMSEFRIFLKVCDDWWIHNNLYLSKEARQAFKQACDIAYKRYRLLCNMGHHTDNGLKNTPSSDRYDRYDKKFDICSEELKNAGDEIVKSAALPGLVEGEFEKKQGEIGKETSG